MTEIRNEVWNILICNFEIVSNFGFRASDLAVFNEQKLTKTCPHGNGEKKFLQGNTINRLCLNHRSYSIQ